MSLTVLILSDHTFNPPGGAERYLSIIVPELRKLGINVIAINIKAIKEKTGYLHDPAFEKILGDLLDKFKVDIVHLSILNSPFAFMCMKTLCRLKMPYIATVHSFAHVCPTEYFVMLPELVPCKNPYPNSHCMKCIIAKTKLCSSIRAIPRSLGQMFYNMNTFKSFLRKASFVISPSKIYANLLRKYSINSIHMWHPFSTHSVESEGDGSVTFIGRLEWEKGVHIILGLAKKLKNTKINVIGKGKLSKLFLTCKPYNVIYHGFVNDSKKLDLIAKSSVVIVPSIWCDIFNYVVSEAMSLAKPVVAFDLGGPKEQIESSKGGLLAKPFDIEDFTSKVRYLLENPNEAKKMGSNGKYWVQNNLSPKKYIKRLVRIYKYIVEERVI